MRATEQYFPMRLSIILLEVVLTLESKNLKCDHSHDIDSAVLSSDSRCVLHFHQYKKRFIKLCFIIFL